MIIVSRRTWKIKTLPTLSSHELTSTDFAKYYPDLPSGSTISNKSPINERYTVQQILYQRGLLPVFPTGAFGIETEKAILRFQFLKNIKEQEKKTQKFIIGPKTVDALNQLKQKMKDPEYLKKTPLPATNDLTGDYEKRMTFLQQGNIQKTKLPQEKATEQNTLKQPRSLWLNGSMGIQKRDK